MNHYSKTAVIIPAAGSGERLGANLPKALVQIVGRTLLEHSYSRLSPVAAQIIVAAPAGFEDRFRELLGDSVTIVTGGSTRTQSVKLALAALNPEIEYVLVHDAARALASTDLAKRVLAALAGGDVAVIPGLAVTDTVKEIDADSRVVGTPDRARLVAVQTPQGFDRQTLVNAHQSAADATDDAALVELLGQPVRVIAGEAAAFKITHPEDIERATNLLTNNKSSAIRVGVGTDAHAFSSDPSRPMWLAGLHWPDEIGVDGHSDGDVAAHAICDALFAATGLGDLGSNFGTSDPKYSGASGATLLQETLARISAAGFDILNVSVQIVGNQPKIGPRRSEAIAALSAPLGGALVSVTATTTDGLGFTGEGKGISAVATALVVRR
jgi:2-C-methyl-D-erythritol 4-phosphate cytidylyltransferase/2-C-methyl-D-erythritol 2,4-cyclodiphosphate synthase